MVDNFVQKNITSLNDIIVKHSFNSKKHNSDDGNNGGTNSSPQPKTPNNTDNSKLYNKEYDSHKWNTEPSQDSYDLKDNDYKNDNDNRTNNTPIDLDDDLEID